MTDAGRDGGLAEDAASVAPGTAEAASRNLQERSIGRFPSVADSPLEADLARASSYAGAAAADNTMRAYRADWEHYAAWCGTRGVQAMPADPAVVAAYLGSMAETHAPSTLQRRLAALARAHRFANEPWDARNPVMRETLAGIMRRHGRPPDQAGAIDLDALRRMTAACDHGPTGRRDNALLLIGFAGAMRRAELCDLRVGDVTKNTAGLEIVIRRSKGDKARLGATVGLPRGANPETCPVRALDSWMALMRQPAGPLLRRVHRSGMIGNDPLNPGSVGRIIARRARQAGIEEDAIEKLSAHSLRVGFVTTAYEKGVRDEDIMAHTRHKDHRTMRGYVRRAGLLEDSPAGKIGL